MAAITSFLAVALDATVSLVTSPSKRGGLPCANLFWTGWSPDYEDHTIPQKCRRTCGSGACIIIILPGHTPTVRHPDTGTCGNGTPNPYPTGGTHTHTTLNLHIHLQSVKEIPQCGISNVKEDLDKARTELAQFPEGGIAACRLVSIKVWTLLRIPRGLVFTVADFYTRHYLTNVSPSAISWIGGINAFLTAGLGLVSGTLYDRGYLYVQPPRALCALDANLRSYHLLIGGSLLQSFILFVLSLTQPGQYYEGIGLGIAQGILYVPTLAVVSHYFRQRRTLAMCLVATGTSLGSVVHPIMLNNLFDRVGFANDVRISATFVSVLLLVACVLVRTRLEPPKYPASYLSVGKGIFHDVPYCLMCVGNSETFSFYSLVILNGGSLIGRLSTGFIAPRIGVPRLMIITTAAERDFHSRHDRSGPRPDGRGIRGDLWVFCWHFDPSELGARMGVGFTMTGFDGLFSALLTEQYKWWKPSLFSGSHRMFVGGGDATRASTSGTLG
ncbi:hypothetical protein HD554DRAFT_2037355 [Boletus coccyginus]|nr:hypothetical protein HD554DRAFT_2037355 [Boletus coccyginus]